jgi:hypothetical protein
MSGWLQFWTVLLCAGIGGYFLMALILIPLGLRDALRMLRRLGPQRDRE